MRLFVCSYRFCSRHLCQLQRLELSNLASRHRVIEKPPPSFTARSGRDFRVPTSLITGKAELRYRLPSITPQTPPHLLIPVSTSVTLPSSNSPSTNLVQRPIPLPIGSNLPQDKAPCHETKGHASKEDARRPQRRGSEERVAELGNPDFVTSSPRQQTRNHDLARNGSQSSSEEQGGYQRMSSSA